MKKLYLKTSFLIFLLMPCFSINASSLKEDVTRTIQTNPDILAKIKGWLAAEKDISRAKGGYFPSIDINANLGEDHVKNSNTNFNYDSLYTNGASISLKQLIFDGFFTPNEVKRTTNRSLAEKYRAQSTTNDTGLLASKAYLDVLTTKQIVELAKNNLNYHKQIYSMLQKRADTGIGREADVVQAASRLALANNNLFAAENNYLDAQATYYKIVGIEPQNLILPAEPLDSRLPINKEIAVKDAIENHPLLKSADADIAEAMAQHKESQATNYPQLNVVLNASADTNLSGIKGDYGDQSAMLQLSYNIFRGGSDVAKQKSTAYQVDQARQIRQNTYTQVVENMKLSWNALITAKNQTSYFIKRRDASVKTVTAYYQQFQINKRTLLDLLNAENEAFQAKIDYVNNKANVIFTKFRVLNAEGKLLTYLNVPNLDEITKSKTYTPTVNHKTNISQQNIQPKTIIVKNNDSSKTDLKVNNPLKIKVITAELADKYTITLYNSNNKDDVVAFMAKNNLQKNAAFYQTKLPHEQYVVIYGIYNSAQKAKEALEYLPKNLKLNNNLSIKSLNKIQEEINYKK